MAEYGAKRGIFLSVKDPTKGIGTVRNELGQFVRRDRGAIIGRFDQLAERAQANVVDNIAARIQRPSVSTGRLVKVTADPRNRYADEFGFGVGIEDYLDKSEAKYWRTIEEGSAVAWADTPGGRSSMVGMKLRGYFGGSIVGFYQNRWGTVPRGGSPITWIGKGTGGKFIPNRKARSKGVVQHDIRPMHAYRDAFEHGGDFTTKPAAEVGQFLQDMVRIAIVGR